MCSVLAWKTGLEAIAKAETLLHQSLGSVERKMPKSFKSWRGQHSSAAVEANAPYLDFVEERETVSCFLALQVTQVNQETLFIYLCYCQTFN